MTSSMSGSDGQPVPSKPQEQQLEIMSFDCESVLNLTLSDPPRWGWTAAGSIADLLPPHERSRRRTTILAYRKQKRKQVAIAASKARARASASNNSTQPRGNKSGRKAVPQVTAIPKATPVSISGEASVSGSGPTKTLDAAKSTARGTSGGAPSDSIVPDANMLESTSATMLCLSKADALVDSATVLGDQEKDTAVQSQTTDFKEKPPEPAQSSANPPSAKPIPMNVKQHPQDRTGKSEGKQTAKETTQDDSEKDSSETQSRAVGVAATAPSGTESLEHPLSDIPGKKKINGRNALQPQKTSFSAKVLGIQKELLGMSTSKVEPANNGTNKNDNAAKRKRSVYDCRIKAIHENEKGDQILDMYSYHRGREGFEPRNPDTGELRCPMQATDTNFDNDAPRLTFTVSIAFPLEDAVEPASNRYKSPKAMYRDSLHWDLGDPSTPSPMVFATEIANEFGLDYYQMMELAMNIQSQIDAHTQQNFNYSTPISAKDPSGNERRYVGSSIQTNRYGQVLPAARGGTRIARKERPQMHQSGSSRPPSVADSSTSGTARRVGSNETAMKEPIEEKYREEVKRRSQAESNQDIVQRCQNGVVGLTEQKENGHCHVCHKRCTVSYGFACRVQSHAYCEIHCKSRLPNFDATTFVCPFCPVCSLSCTCSKCSKKLESVSRDFKEEVKAQDATLETAVFVDVLTKCRRAAFHVVKRTSDTRKDDEADSPTPKNASKPRRSSTGFREPRKALLVPKPPIHDFPREICGSLELEPGAPDDYLKVYTHNGTHLADDYPEAWSEKVEKSSDGSAYSLPTSSGEIVEDGNVDYCQVCRNHGNLVCCDCCPRAFHVDCIRGDSQSSSDERWECDFCQNEKKGLEKDRIDGKHCLDSVCASFVHVDVTSEKALASLEAMSIIHEMLTFLIHYDFGYMFAEPVDVNAIPGYKNIVQNPIDLGTIRSRLINNGYTGIVTDGGSYDDVLTAILKDIELVWHNCFAFNFDGSAIYRMASLQKSRAMAMQRKSFDHLLAHQVREAVREYVKSLEEARSELSNTQAANANPLIDAKERELRSRRPKGKHKITVKVAKANVNRPVAIFDPISGRIMKIYSSVKSAGHAAHTMISVGHRCEMSSTQDMVRQVVVKSSSDPSSLLFGYRWLMLEDLRMGNVQFREDVCDGVEIRYENYTYVFLSVDEALSFPHLPKSLLANDLRQQLTSMGRCGSWQDVAGMKWRRLPPSGFSKYVDPVSSNSENNPIVFDTPAEEDVPDLEKLVLQHCSVIKEDLVTNRKLMGFENVHSAFLDWKGLADMSPTFPAIEGKTLLTFQKYYLDGDRNIDCVVWRSQEPLPVEPAKSDGMSTSEACKPSHDMVASPHAPEGNTAQHLGAKPHTSICENPSAQIAMDVDTEDDATRKRKREEALTPAAPQEAKSISDGQNTPDKRFSLLGLFKSSKKPEQKMIAALTERKNGKEDRAPSDPTAVAS